VDKPDLYAVHRLGLVRGSVRHPVRRALLQVVAHQQGPGLIAVAVWTPWPDVRHLDANRTVEPELA
jgi:hypothetical protein